MYNPVPLEEIVPYIDWTPFFHAWELRGIYPKIFDQEGVGPKAKRTIRGRAEAFKAHRKRKAARSSRRDRIFSCKQRGRRHRSLRGRIAPPAYDVSTRCGNRQPERIRSQAMPWRILSRRATSGKLDYVGMFAVTAGLRIEPLVAKFEKENDDYNALMAKALADRLAEGLAELMHQRRAYRMGLRQGRKSHSRRSDSRALPRHSSRARISGAARSHGKTSALRSDLRGKKCGHHADGKFRDVSRGFGQRLLFFTS